MTIHNISILKERKLYYYKDNLENYINNSNINLRYDNYYDVVKHCKSFVHHNPYYNKRLKYYWARWHQKRNTNFEHGFKNHFKAKPTKESILKEIKEIKTIINNYANNNQYSVNNHHVKALYKQLHELENYL